MVEKEQRKTIGQNGKKKQKFWGVFEIKKSPEIELPTIQCCFVEPKLVTRKTCFGTWLRVISGICELGGGVNVGEWDGSVSGGSECPQEE